MFWLEVDVIRWDEPETACLPIDYSGTPQPPGVLVFSSNKNYLSRQRRELIFASCNIVPLR
jgi:hypothetical protein